MIAGEIPHYLLMDKLSKNMDPLYRIIINYPSYSEN